MRNVFSIQRAVGALLLPLLFSGAATAASPQEEALWQKVRSDPDIVLVLRHGAVAAQRGQTGAAFDVEGQCRGEMMLSDKGREQAGQIGRAFRERGVDPHVVSSAMCRTRDTAMLAFGRAELDPALRESLTGDRARFQEFLGASKAWILKYRGARPLALFMHLPNIDSLTGEQPREGEMLVTRSTEAGELDVLGKIVLHQP